MENTNAPQEEKAVKKEGSVGATIGSVIVILIIAAGGLYFLDILKQRVPAEKTQILEDDLFSIEAELDATEIDTLDADLVDIENEIDAALAE